MASKPVLETLADVKPQQMGGEGSDKENWDRCVRHSSILIVGGIICGAIATVATGGGMGIIVGTSLGYAAATGNCLRVFNTKKDDCKLTKLKNVHNQPQPQSREETQLNECSKLPPITKKMKETIEREEEKKKRKQSKETQKECAQPRYMFQRKDPPDNKKCPCKNKNPQKSNKEEKEIQRKDAGDSKSQPESNPLKRFTNPKKREVIDRDAALKETYRTYPLKRFKNPKEVVRTCEGDKKKK